MTTPRAPERGEESFMVTCERDGTIVLSIVAVSRSFHTLAQPSRGWRVELSGDERLVSDTKRSRRRTSSCLVMNVWCLTPNVHRCCQHGAHRGSCGSRSAPANESSCNEAGSRFSAWEPENRDTADVPPPTIRCGGSGGIGRRRVRSRLSREGRGVNGRCGRPTMSLLPARRLGWGSGPSVRARACYPTVRHS